MTTPAHVSPISQGSLASTLIGVLLLAATACDERRATVGTAAPERPDTRSGTEILREMIAAYRQAEAYSDAGRIGLRYPRDGATIEQWTELHVQFRRPNRLVLDVRREDNQIVIACDGQQLQAEIKDPGTANFGSQQVQRPAPERLTVPLVYAAGEYADPAQPQELLSVLLGVPVPLALTQLGLLLDEGALARLAAAEHALELLDPAPVDGHACHRVRVRGREGEFVFWVDQQLRLLRRLELPAGELPAGDQTAGSGRPELVADFVGARFEAPAEDAAFQLPEVAGQHKVRYFVLPPPPLPSPLLGTKVGAYHFTDLDGRSLPSSGLSARCLVLTWFQDHPACQLSLTAVDAVAEKFRDQPEVTFLAACTEPSTALSHADVAQLARGWNVGLRCVRDLEACGRDVFQIRQAPTTVVLGPQGAVQMVEVGANPQLAEQLQLVVERILDGEDVAADVVRQVKEETAAYERQLALAGVDAPAVDLEIPLPDVAPAAEPQRMRKTARWHCRDVPDPGNVLAVVDPDGKPQLLVHSGWRRLVPLDLDGNVQRTIELPVPEDAAISYLRTAVDGQGRRLHVGAARLGRQLLVFDHQWRLVLAYPDAEQPHDGIQDVQLADLDGDGQLELYVAFQGLAGVQCVGLDGQRLWSNRSVAGALSLAIAPAEGPVGQLLLSTPRGQLVPVSADGQSRRPITIGRHAIHHLVRSAAPEPGPAPLCGMAYSADGGLTAVGLAADRHEAWSYRLPPGIHRTQIQYLASAQVLPGAGYQWLLAGPDGSVHVITEDGDFHDHFQLGEFIRGIAGVRSGNRSLLVLTTDSGVQALELGWPDPGRQP